MNDKILDLQKKMKKKLNEYRYEHTLGVMYTSAALAMRHGVDLEQALVAGLLHDCAKCYSDEKKFELCEKYGVVLTAVERQNTALIHAKLGAVLAREKYEVASEDVCQAIATHTTGAPAMKPLQQIVFIADYIEPARDKAPHLAEIRKLAFQDLNECIYEILKDTLLYLNKNPDDIDNTTKDAFDYYSDLHNSRFPETNATEHPNKES